MYTKVNFKIAGQKLSLESTDTRLGVGLGPYLEQEFDYFGVHFGRGSMNITKFGT